MASEVIYSLDAEKHVIAGMLNFDDLIIGTIDAISAEDLFVPAHKVLFETLYEMKATGKPIEPMSLHLQLVKQGVAESVGSPGIIGELAGAFVMRETIGHYVEIVRRHAASRRVVAICQKTTERLLDDPDAPDAAVVSTIDLLRAVQDQSSIQKVGKTGKELTIDYQAHLDSVGLAGPKGLETGWATLDSHLLPLTAGLTVVAARPGVGKSAFLINLLRQWCEQGYNVGLMTLEMTQRQVMTVLTSQVSGVLNSRLRRKLEDKDQVAVDTALGMIGDWRIVVDDSTSQTIYQIVRKAHQWKRKHNIDVLLIDYIQLITGTTSRSAENRVNEIAQISRGLKNLSKDLDIPILSAAQLNRKSQETDDKPQLHHLRESGSIEQDANNVIMIHPLPGKTHPSEKKIEVIIRKQREGPADVSAKMNFNSLIQRITDDSGE